MIATKDLAEFVAEAHRFTLSLVPHEHGATLVTLSGDLGAGKTTFVQEMARTLGVEEVVTSPTFVLEKVYTLEGKAFAHLIHIDAYRLKSAHELDALGWAEVMREPGNLVVLEWPERVAQAVPKDAIRITLNGSGDMREIVYGT